MCIIFYYKKQNRYSFNALIGAIEEDKFFDKVEIYIPSNEKDLLKTIKENEKRFNIILVVFSFFTTQIWDIENLIKKIKDKCSKNIILLAGGPHPTGEPIKTLKMGFDYVLCGEGEEIFPYYAKNILLGNSLNKIGKANKTSYINLNKFFPFPHKKIVKFGPIEITRGCPFFCNYCQTSRIFGGKVRHRDIDTVCRIVEYMKNHNRTDIRFITPNAFCYGSENGKKINIRALEALLKSVRNILKSNGRIFLGSFPSEVRPEHVNEETLSILKKYADNINLVIGAQSGSEKILKICNRQHSVNDIYNAVKLSVKFNLIPNVDFIFGLPEETEEDVRESILVMKDLLKLGARIHAHSFMPLPQTPFKIYPPRKIDRLIFKEFSHYIPKGLIYGNYIYQEKIAEKIFNYLKR